MIGKLSNQLGLMRTYLGRSIPNSEKHWDLLMHSSVKGMIRDTANPLKVYAMVKSTVQTFEFDAASQSDILKTTTDIVMETLAATPILDTADAFFLVDLVVDNADQNVLIKR